MIKKSMAILMVFILFFGFHTPVYALPNEQSLAIQSFLDEAQRISGAPGMSVSVFAEGEAHFFSSGSGVISREVKMLSNEETLWELASVSKAFTALGLLYLEEQGLLSLSDSIAMHLPWLTLRYQGQPVDMQDVKLYNFMHHTVGITNSRHPNLVMDRAGPDTMQNTVESLIDAELAFFPGERMEYGTKNYNVLGLVIESVSGQKFETFMEEQIFLPLGLTQTYAHMDNAEAAGRLAAGHATSFIFFTQRRDSPEAAGSVPTGYIITSAKDMARWMEIQMGMAEDIPEIFQTIIQKSHVADKSVEAEESDGLLSHYAAGWFIGAKQPIIKHGGGNPGFSTYIILFPQEQIGMTLLSNASGVNTHLIVENIKDILDGNLEQSYSMGILQILDIVLTLITGIGILLAILFLLLGLRRKKQSQKCPASKKRIALTAFWFILALAACILCFGFPRLLFNASWSFILTWLPYSFLTGIIVLAILCASITWFMSSRTALIPVHNKERP